MLLPPLTSFFDLRLHCAIDSLRHGVTSGSSLSRCPLSPDSGCIFGRLLPPSTPFFDSLLHGAINSQLHCAPHLCATPNSCASMRQFTVPSQVRSPRLLPPCRRRRLARSEREERRGQGGEEAPAQGERTWSKGKGKGREEEDWSHRAFCFAHLEDDAGPWPCWVSPDVY